MERYGILCFCTNVSLFCLDNRGTEQFFIHT